MAKITLTNKDIAFLDEWRAARAKDELCNFADRMIPLPNPVKTLTITLPNSYVYKAIRNEKQINFYLTQGGISRGSIKMELVMGNAVRVIKNSLNCKEPVKMGDLLYSVYYSLILYMVHGERKVKLAERIDKSSKPRKGQKPKKVATYLFPAVYERIGKNKEKRNYTSPTEAFNVRGHFRHYKNGKTVWVKEYTKGKGKEKETEYRL